MTKPHRGGASTPPVRRFWALSLGVLVTAGVLAHPPAASAAEPAPPTPTGRATAVEYLRTGGLVVSRAAETALLGSDQDVRHFIDTDLGQAQITDDRVRLASLMAASGPAVTAAAQSALSGTPADVRAFLTTGYKAPYLRDLRFRVAEIMAVGGRPPTRPPRRRSTPATPRWPSSW